MFLAIAYVIALAVVLLFFRGAQALGDEPQDQRESEGRD